MGKVLRLAETGGISVAEACVQAIAAEQFLILPHPEVRDYMRNKTENYERWIGGMRKLNRRFGASTPAAAKPASS
ncbi:MAG: hypothetical protein RL597_768 [Pseudomonadota bacterium]